MLKKTTLLIFVLAWLSSCSVEHETIKNQQAKSIVKSSLLEGAEAQKVQEKVQSVIRRAPDPFQIGNLHSRSEIPVSVDYSRIMQVVDSLGNTTYSMYVKNHPLETNKIFFNVVARSVTDSDLQLKLLKFEKSYLTIYDSETQVGSIKDFSGLVITAPITPETPTDPCPPEDVVSPGGGSYFPGSPDSSTPGNGNQGSGGAGTQQIEQPCEQILLQFLCCHGIHSGESQNCKCKDTDGNIGATYLVDGCAGTITQVYRPLANTESEPSDPCEEAQPPTGVVSPISECQGAFYSSLFMDSPQREFLNSRPDIEAAINGLLFRTDDCQATMELVNWAIEYLMENPEAKIDFLNKIIQEPSFSKNPCLTNIYNGLGNSAQFRQYIKNFDGDFPVSHLRLNTSSSLPSNINAQTSPPENYVITITFNSNNLNRPKLSIARTFIHELIHAEIFRKLMECSSLPNLNFPNYTDAQWRNFIINLRNNYPGLYDYYERFFFNIPAGQTTSDEQHQLMAQHYRNTIIEALKAYDNTQADEVYEALSWVGLQGTVAWENLTAAERAQIINQITIFDSSNNSCE